jgi:hypothetical protein
MFFGVKKNLKDVKKSNIIKKPFKKDTPLTPYEVTQLLEYHPELSHVELNGCDHLKPIKVLTTKDEVSSGDNTTATNLGKVIYYNDHTKGQAFYNKFFGQIPPDHLSFFLFDNPLVNPSEVVPTITGFNNGSVVSFDTRKLSDNNNYSVLVTEYKGKKLKIKIAGSYYDVYRNKQFPYFYIDSGLEFVRINENCQPEFKLKKLYGTLFNKYELPTANASFGKKKSKISSILRDIKFLKLN